MALIMEMKKEPGSVQATSGQPTNYSDTVFHLLTSHNSYLLIAIFLQLSQLLLKCQTEFAQYSITKQQMTLAATFLSYLSMVFPRES